MCSFLLTLNLGKQHTFGIHQTRKAKMKTLVVLAYLVIGISVTIEAEPDANENKVIEDQKVTDDQKIFRGKFSGKRI